MITFAFSVRSVISIYYITIQLHQSPLTCTTQDSTLEEKVLKLVQILLQNIWNIDCIVATVVAV